MMAMPNTRAQAPTGVTDRERSSIQVSAIQMENPAHTRPATTLMMKRVRTRM